MISFLIFSSHPNMTRNRNIEKVDGYAVPNAIFKMLNIW